MLRVVYGEADPTALGLPLFSLAVGLVDGFNPCAMWVLLFLLSLLVHLRDWRRIALIAGTFVAASGAVYYSVHGHLAQPVPMGGAVRPSALGARVPGAPA